MRLNLADSRIVELLALWGMPYSYGGGKPSDAVSCWPPKPLPHGRAGGPGVDCSGAAQMMLVRLAILEPGAPDRTAASLSEIATPVEAGAAQLGDLAFYGSTHPSHVMVHLGGDVVIGATGGGSTTNGTDPRAFVQLERTLYRGDFRGFRRWPNVADQTRVLKGAA